MPIKIYLEDGQRERISNRENIFILTLPVSWMRIKTPEVLHANPPHFPHGFAIVEFSQFAG